MNWLRLQVPRERQPSRGLELEQDRNPRSVGRIPQLHRAPNSERLASEQVTYNLGQVGNVV